MQCGRGKAARWSHRVRHHRVNPNPTPTPTLSLTPTLTLTQALTLTRALTLARALTLNLTPTPTRTLPLPLPLPLPLARCGLIECDVSGVHFYGLRQYERNQWHLQYEAMVS